MSLCLGPRKWEHVRGGGLGSLTQLKILEKWMAYFYRRYTVPSQAVFTRRELYNDAEEPAQITSLPANLALVSRCHLVRWRID